ncbi:MAG: DUF882 domain-containing protein [Lysobacter sp.]|nr:MAG: DUF882 domain-containing protein [Lysobacter sp.]
MPHTPPCARKSARSLASIALAGIALAACNTLQPPIETRYARWVRVSEHRAETERYVAYLRSEGVGEVVPTMPLSRSARDWKRCKRDEFAVPPDTLQANMVPTLRVIARLRDEGILDPALARSVYRDADLNTCAGGSPGSKHLQNRAIDFDLPDRPDNVARLCGFWREHGEALQMGLGFYSPTTIHIDTGGYRTWGTDYTRRTSLCLPPEAQPESRGQSQDQPEPQATPAPTR